MSTIHNIKINIIFLYLNTQIHELVSYLKFPPTQVGNSSLIGTSFIYFFFQHKFIYIKTER